MPDGENPYAPPAGMNPGALPTNLPPIFVDGDCLVVEDGAVLPSRCVFTDESVDEPLVMQTLTWSPSFRLVAAARTAKIQFAVGPAAVRRHRQTLTFTSAGLLITGLVLYGLTGQMSVGLVIGAASVISFFAKIQYLTVQKFEPDRFWLRGCGPEFLQSCRDEFGSLPQ